RLAGKEVREISSDALELLQRHRWPGNVGELKRVIQDAVEQAGPPLLTQELIPSYLCGSAVAGRIFPNEGLDLPVAGERFEKSLLKAALDQTKGVQIQAAKLLGLKITTLNSKIARYGIDLHEHRVRPQDSDRFLRRPRLSSCSEAKT